ncbi:DNA mismatch repair protein MutS [Saprospira sp. CCB-QB6]|uniref:MutS-related protein n=1 Tax=Saprospira sp. CCB-QB6 TaxID=3023936 RepID=UPI00234AD042|nr:DNA mismatch repair protein MutS [Saprospira sp. CCB-QB6]WCL80023.1 DNA mismatch repair protein MutS [Saprospira sp. CCB-QB6]
MSIYAQRLDQFTTAHKQAQQQFNLLSIARLITVGLFIVAGYYYLDNQESLWAYLLLASTLAFFALLRLHDKVKIKRDRLKELTLINEQELAHTQNGELPFDDGQALAPQDHPYSHDLDLFGPNSLYQLLNRTATPMGQAALQKDLLEGLEKTEILARHAAIEELKEELDWRQEFLAQARLAPEGSQSLYPAFVSWTQREASSVHPLANALRFIFPIGFLLALIAYVFTFSLLWERLAEAFFILNIILVQRHLKAIQAESLQLDRLRPTLRQYGILLQLFEKKTWQSPLLQNMQANLRKNGPEAAQALSQLGRLLAGLDSISNLVGALLFNGIGAYHLHLLAQLYNWRKKYAKELNEWLLLLGELESLNSLANLAYNRPDYQFPELQNSPDFYFEDLKHPLLPIKQAVGNELDLRQQKLIILTGSNMSGKSTFLRAMGLAMVMARMGSVVAAKTAQLQALPLYLSMRVNDSLSENASYFFAEVKRLQTILEALKREPHFVLLDEILRGTNSDDKRNGTLGVLRKLVEYKAVGALATHDLEVCALQANYPNYLLNACFEVEIREQELYFDYKLRKGICQNQSASFLMRKYL